MKIGNDILRIVPLGAGQEVGRSCVYLQYKGKTIMFDCGIHVAFQGQEALPMFDHIDHILEHFHICLGGHMPTLPA